MTYNNPDIELKIIELNEIGIYLTIAGAFLFLMTQYQKKVHVYNTSFQTNYENLFSDTDTIDKYAITLVCLGSLYLLYSSYIELLYELDRYEKTGNDANLNAAYSFLTANTFQFTGTFISLYTAFFLNPSIIEPTL